MNEKDKAPSRDLQQNIKQQAQQRHSSNASYLANTFFEVTVNSDKLSKLFSNLDEIIFQQNKKIVQLNKDLHNKFESLQDKIAAESKKNGLLFTKLDLRINQASNTQYCYVMDIHKKSEQRDQELNHKIQATVSKIGRVQDTLKEDLKNGLVFLKKQIVGNINQQQLLMISPEPPKQIKTQHIIQRKTQRKIQHPERIDFGYIIRHFQQQINKLQLNLPYLFQGLFNQKQIQNKKKHTQNMIDLTYRRDQLQSNIALRQGNRLDQGFSKVVYPTGKNKQNFNEVLQSIKPSGKQKRHMSLSRPNGMQEILTGFQEMIDKVQRLQQNDTQQNQIISDMKNKQIVTDQKVTIMNRKLQKNCFETAQIKTALRRVQNLKMDDKTIEELRHYIKWAVRDLQQKISLKCSNQDLNKQKSKLIDKISILHENLIQKADKGEIQKALVFLQNKIKEIILLIAADHTEQKQGAIMKVAAKCLSCDKQVQRQLQSQSKCRRDLIVNKQNQGQYVKSMTHRVRQRYRKQMAQTTGNQTFQQC